MNKRSLDELISLIHDHSESIVDDGAGNRESMIDDFAEWLDQQSIRFDRAAFWDACGGARCQKGHEATGNMGVPWCAICNRAIKIDWVIS